MEFDKIKQIRVLHMLVISAFIVVILLPTLREMIPYWEYVFAFGYVLCWILGIRYERQVILNSGVADASEVRVAERNAASWIFKGKDPEDPR